MPKRAAILRFAGIERRVPGSACSAARSSGSFRRDAQDLFRAAAKQRQRAVRGDRAAGPPDSRNSRGISRPASSLPSTTVETTTPLFAADARAACRAARRLRRMLHQDLARAVQRRLGIGDARLSPLFGSERPACRYLAASASGIERRDRPAALGQRLQPGLARDLRLGAALGLVGQIQIFQPLLGSACFDGVRAVPASACPAPRCWPGSPRAALPVRAGRAGAPPDAQLRVVQPAGGFLAVAGDERHGRAFVQQRDGRGHLRHGLAASS